MNKKLLATAMGIALAGAMSSASAEVKIFGYIHESYDIYNNSVTSYKCSDGVNTCTSSSGSGLSNNASNIGFKGSEDIGGGNAFIWQIDSYVDLVNGDAKFANYNTYGGFRGDWGTLFAGHHDSALKMADTHIVPFNNTIGDARTIMGTGSDGKNYLNQRFSKAVAYVTPNFMGFNGYVMYVGSPSSAGSSQPDNTKNGGYDIAASYNNGPIKGWLAYEDQTSSISNSDIKAFRVSGSYDFNPFKVGAIYENVNAGSNPALASIDRNAWGVFGMMKMGMNDIGLSYYKADSSRLGNDGADQWALGAYHHFTKQTDVYAMYARMNNDSAGNYVLGGGGSGHGMNMPGAAAGDNPSAFSIGFEHKF